MRIYTVVNKSKRGTSNFLLESHWTKIPSTHLAKRIGTSLFSSDETDLFTGHLSENVLDVCSNKLNIIILWYILYIFQPRVRHIILIVGIRSIHNIIIKYTLVYVHRIIQTPYSWLQHADRYMTMNYEYYDVCRTVQHHKIML